MNIFLYIKARGFTLFFAMLVGSLALAVGLAIYDLTIRELDLSAAATQSQYAIYAADTGAECALYWDSKFGSVLSTDADGSAFATSTDGLTSGQPGGNAKGTAGIGVGQISALCNSQDISAGSAPLSYVWQVTTSPAPDSSHATTTFELSLGASASAPCALVVVAKSGNPAQTVVTSHGYNTCNQSTLQLERVLQVSY